MKKFEENQITVTTELEALSSVPGINDWLKVKSEELAKDAGGKALEWLSSEFFKAIGIGGTGEIDQIQKLLDQIIQLQHEILDKLNELLTEVKFQHLIT